MRVNRFWPLALFATLCGCGSSTPSGSSSASSSSSGATGGGSGSGSGSSSGSSGATGATSAYDLAVLADQPVAYLALGHPDGGEPDLTGNGHEGTYIGGTATSAAMPNADLATVFDGVSQYLTIASSPAFSIPTTGSLSWEVWIRPDVLQFTQSNGSYVDFMGKCELYAPTCEWEARMYNANNSQNRCSRISAYAFNPGAGLGSGADWQPTCGLFQAGQWHHVVGLYTTVSQPANCPADAPFPGSLDIWVDGVEWDQAVHSPTGCMSQYSVAPVAHDSAVNVGTMAVDSFFQGAIGKVAIYNYLLSPAQIAAHFQAMGGHAPSGSCADTCSIP